MPCGKKTILKKFTSGFISLTRDSILILSWFCKTWMSTFNLLLKLKIAQSGRVQCRSHPFFYQQITPHPHSSPKSVNLRYSFNCRFEFLLIFSFKAHSVSPSNQLFDCWCVCIQFTKSHGHLHDQVHKSNSDKLNEIHSLVSHFHIDCCK